jgi:hypothetical protein
MQYEVEFRNKSGEKKRVVVALEPDEARSVNSLRALRGTEEAGLMAISYATRRGYQTVPTDFEYFGAVAVPDSNQSLEKTQCR